MDAKSNKTSKAAAIASLLAGGAVAGSFISAEPAKAQFIGADSQSRVSAAVTSVLSNGVTNSFAAEIVFPEQSIASTGVASVGVNYATIGADASQLAITSASIGAATAAYSAATVEAATARAIDAAKNLSQYGDVIGIVKSWQSGGSAALD
ncbi:TEK-like protein [Sphaerospermopsis aphanizomenoides BCCUSP55]|uniref:TEK-like protein n=1 Tax=Sphaerospermopsis aphanizomenoides TaxID=459663 RepID=UPI001905BA08|nr:TEK-like protein [Sphaerospermopsis aphanizomenoides]MBK1988948.1 TEK-like protein [Sphaerospermopsis aphanizomenoides BCCUSP55]